MVNMFSYNAGTQEFNDIVDEAVAFAKAQVEGAVIADKETRVKNHNLAILKYCAAGTRAEDLCEKNGLAAYKMPQVTRDKEFRANFDAVIAQVINPIMPMVANNDLVRLMAEVRQVGYGDTARFVIKSNDLFKVNELAEGVARGVMQPIYNNEITVEASPVSIDYDVDWYALASGVLDLGDFALRVSRSFEGYIFLRIIAAINTAVGDLPAAYRASGFSNANWSRLAQLASAANGKSEVFAIGSLNALNAVVPTSAGLQYGLGEKIASQGYLDKYLGTRLVVLDQALQFNTVNTTGTFALPDDMIYFLPVYGDRPVKIVYEGNTILVDHDATQTSDKTYRIHIEERVGVGVVLGSKFAALDVQP